jgi:hypothetical protein
MSSQIIFFQKNKADLSYENVSATASQGSAYAQYVLNRSNVSAWLTTGSVDADNTTLTIDFNEDRYVTDLLLLKHNFKSFTVKYWNGSSYVAFSPAIAPTNNTAASNHYEVTGVETSRIQITILGTQTANQDKYLYQFIATEQLGQLNAWLMIKNPTHSRNRIKNKTLSGKLNIVENVGGFSCRLTVKSLTNSSDLNLIEELYAANEGFLVWLCGGDESQFLTRRQGYRMEDIYLMKCTDEYQPEYVDGVYKNGIKIEIDLQEVID